MIHEPHLAAELDAEKECMGDFWWRDFKKANDLFAALTALRLILFALLVIPNIVRIEALHASIRQILRRTGVTNIPDFMRASCQFFTAMAEKKCLSSCAQIW